MLVIKQYGDNMTLDSLFDPDSVPEMVIEATLNDISIWKDFIDVKALLKLYSDSLEKYNEDLFFSTYLAEMPKGTIDRKTITKLFVIFDFFPLLRGTLVQMMYIHRSPSDHRNDVEVLGTKISEDLFRKILKLYHDAYKTNIVTVDAQLSYYKCVETKQSGEYNSDVSRFVKSAKDYKSVETERSYILNITLKNVFAKEPMVTVLNMETCDAVTRNYMIAVNGLISSLECDEFWLYVGGDPQGVYNKSKLRCLLEGIVQESMMDAKNHKRFEV